MELKIIGSKKLNYQLAQIDNKMRDRVATEMTRVLVAMKKQSRDSINTGARSGKIYKRAGKTRQRSAPGELPKTDTRDLVNSFSNTTEKLMTRVVGRLVNDSDHASLLEFSSPTKGGRPFMRPLWKIWRPIVRIKFVEIMNKLLRESAK